jgi:site-specific DNA recombinase
VTPEYPPNRTFDSVSVSRVAALAECNFEPLVDEATFYRAQAVLDGRVVVAGPRQRNHQDFPLRGTVRCEICGRPLTGSWSKGRNGHYAYYHCQRQCRSVNASKAALEGAFADELALLQPTPGYVRLVKDRILRVWEQRRAEANDRTVAQQRRVSAIIDSSPVTSFEFSSAAPSSPPEST